MSVRRTPLENGRMSQLGPKDSFAESWCTGLKDSFGATVPRVQIHHPNKIIMYHSYILKSSKDGRFYYGSTQNIEERILKHNSGNVKSTKHRRPLILHFSEEHQTHIEAFQREMFYKSIQGYQYLKQNGII